MVVGRSWKRKYGGGGWCSLSLWLAASWRSLLALGGKLRHSLLAPTPRGRVGVQVHVAEDQPSADLVGGQRDTRCQLVNGARSQPETPSRCLHAHQVRSLRLYALPQLSQDAGQFLPERLPNGFPHLVVKRAHAFFPIADSPIESSRRSVMGSDSRRLSPTSRPFFTL